MAYNELTFTEREQSLGDMAESVFEKYCDYNNIIFENFGQNHSPLNQICINAYIRGRPDYICENRIVSFVECKGVGSDGIFKFKLKSREALDHWKEYHPIALFIYNSHKQEICFMKYDTFLDILPGMEIKAFHEGNEYWAIPTTALRWEQATYL